MGLSDADVGLVTAASKAPAQSFPAGLSDEAVGLPPDFEREAAEGPNTAIDIAKGIGFRLVGTAAQVSDMFTGVGKALLGSATYWGARTAVTAQGEDARTAATAAQMTKDYFFPQEISAPWGKVAEALGPEAKDAYEDNPVAWIMGHISDFIRHGSEKMAKATGLQAEDFVALADQFMGSIGYKVIRPAVVKAFKARVAEMKAGGEARTAVGELKETPEGVPLENPDPARYRPQYDTEGRLSGWEDVSKPITEAEASAVTSKQVKEIFTRAKKRGAPEAQDAETVAEIFRKALRPREKPVVEVPGVEKTRIAEPSIVGQPVPEPLVTVLDSAFEKIRLGERPTLDATELLALRAFEKASPILDAAGKRMRGEIDWKAAAATFGIGVTGLAAYTLWRKWEQHKAEVEQLELENKSWRQLEQKRQEEEQRRLNPDQELTPRKKMITAGLGITAALLATATPEQLESLAYLGAAGVINLRSSKLFGFKELAKELELRRAALVKERNVIQARLLNERMPYELGSRRIEETQAALNKVNARLNKALEVQYKIENPTEQRGPSSKLIAYRKATALHEYLDRAYTMQWPIDKHPLKLKAAGGVLEISDRTELKKLLDHTKERVDRMNDQAFKENDALRAEQDNGAAKVLPFERGGATLDIYTALVGGSIGALIGMQDSDSPIRSGIYGALAGLALGHPAGRAALKAVIKSPDVALGAISTRLGNIHPALKLMERRHELNILRQIDQLNDQVLPFAQAFDKLPKEQQLAAGRMLMNGQEPMLQTLPTLAPTLPGLRRALSSVETQLKSLGRFKEGLSGYFPRMVSDLEGLKKALGAQYAVGIEKALVNAEAEMIRKASRGLTDVEQSLVVNRYLYAADQTSFQPGFAKGRRVGEVTPELQPFYEPPVESLLRYISGAVSDIQTAKFFGRDLKVNKKGAKVSNDVDGSIGNLASRLITEGKITREQGLELRDILKARFEGGDKGMSTGLAAARNLTNTALLGNLASAATQVGDSLTTIYHHGTVPTIQALAQKLIGRQRTTPKQLGLINHVAEELSEKGITGQTLHEGMKYSTFHAIDMFGKGLNLNAGLIKNTKLASTSKGTAVLLERYGKAFGDEMPQLLEDLRNRRVSDNVETLVFSELSDAQPISKAEMSEAYLRHPNGRILFQLKTYMLKQVDVVRRDVYQNIASGNPKRIMIGAKNLAALGAIYALANVPGDVIKDILAGRDVDPFSVPKLVENVLQTFGINRYAQERLSQGRVVETAQDLATPPVRVFQDIAKGDPKAVGYIPILGRPIYERWFGGNERREISEKRSANVGAPKSERQTLSPAAKEYLRKKRLEAAEKKLQREQR